jgi:SAM-dependent methyltransferase
MASLAHDESLVTALYARYRAYLTSTILEEIAEGDEMFIRGVKGSFEHYMNSGRSAIDVILAAMLTAGKDACPTVLDLPCGAGRVTRHLRPFFHESDLFVADLNGDHQRFVVEHIRGAQPFSAPADFSGAPERAFDLIFVGSLVTHFDSGLLERAVTWLINALAQDGLLVLTTHGRCQEYLERVRHHNVSPMVWDEACRSRDRTGFGFAAYGPDRPEYGLSLMAPSWIIRLVEQEPTTRIISFGESLWNGHHDVLVLQRRSVISAVA